MQKSQELLKQKNGTSKKSRVLGNLGKMGVATSGTFEKFEGTLRSWENWKFRKNGIFEKIGGTWKSRKTKISKSGHPKNYGVHGNREKQGVREKRDVGKIG